MRRVVAAFVIEDTAWYFLQRKRKNADFRKGVQFSGGSIPLEVDNVSPNSFAKFYINPVATIPVANTIITPPTSVNYFVQRTDTVTGCTSTIGKARITVNGPPIMGPVIAPPAICERQTVALTFPTVTEQGSPVINQGWILNGNGFDPATILLAADNGIEVSYFAQSACGIAVTPVITVAGNNKPELTYSDPDPVTDPMTVDLNDLALAVGDTTGLTMSYYDSLYNVLSSAEVAAAVDGTHHIIGTTAEGCADTSTVTGMVG